jgi:coenzyme F420-reducing hydrogenase delta subunit
MPQWPVDALRQQMQSGLAALTGAQRFVVLGCAQGARLEGVAAADVLVLPMVCTGLLPPSFVEYALRAGASGVLVATCREGGCAFRLGERWTRERLSGQREPRLRASVPQDAWALAAVDAGDEAALAAALAGLRARAIEAIIPLESVA